MRANTQHPYLCAPFAFGRAVASELGQAFDIVELHLVSEFGLLFLLLHHAVLEIVEDIQRALVRQAHVDVVPRLARVAAQ
jgi:hypothetical protein